MCLSQCFRPHCSHRVDWSRSEILCCMPESSPGRFGAGHVSCRCVFCQGLEDGSIYNGWPTWICSCLHMVYMFMYMFLYIWMNLWANEIIRCAHQNRFIPESARWLLDRGKTTDAKELIQKAAAINKRTVPDSLLEKVEIYFTN